MHLSAPAEATQSIANMRRMSTLRDDVFAVSGRGGEIHHVDEVIVLPAQLRVGEFLVQYLAIQAQRWHIVEVALAMIAMSSPPAR